MNKLEIEAIRALPEEFVRDGTCIATVGEYVVAACPHGPAILYKDGEWMDLNINVEPPTREEVK